jgi:hypothetical protein
MRWASSEAMDLSHRRTGACSLSNVSTVTETAAASSLQKRVKRTKGRRTSHNNDYKYNQSRIK